MKSLICSMMIVCMLTALLAITPAPATAQAVDEQGEIPAGLQEAILASSAGTFQESGGKYSTSANGLVFELSTDGLQAGGGGLQWAISVQAVGRDMHMEDVSAPVMSQVEGRLEYQRGF